jgi:hypothetical protein
LLQTPQTQHLKTAFLKLSQFAVRRLYGDGWNPYSSEEIWEQMNSMAYGEKSMLSEW